MPQRLLKPLRVGLALSFLVATVWLFLDWQSTTPPAAVDAALYLQFTPSLVRFAYAAGWAAAGFLAVLALTLLFGRVFCSTVCPLGTLQDLIIRLARRPQRRGRRPFHYQHPHRLLRYGLLLAVAATAIGGSGLLLGQLDPFSHFGRILALLVRPLVIAGNNLTGRAFETLGSYAVAPVELMFAPWQAVLGPILLLTLLLWMAGRHGRLFCNSLCPVGALLGMVSRFAVLRIGIDRERCTLCASCALHCKAGCIHIKDQRIDFERCVACFDCVAACPESGIGYRPFWKERRGGDQPVRRPKPPRRPEGERTLQDSRASRRGFLLRGTACLLGLAGVIANAKQWPKNKRPTLIPFVREHPVTPPGAGSTARFNDRCTACQLCVSACPTQVLQPSLLAYGMSGFLQPHMAYEVNYCTYECTRCGQVCPTDAIRPLPLAEKKRAKIGEVHFIKDNCIVVTEKTACGACAEHCPTQAVHMVAYQGDLTIPDLETAVCIGCGACEHACPVRPYRAIYVEGEPVHQVAKAPQNGALKVKVPDQFPF